jgi:maleylacetoacetate isomerase
MAEQQNENALSVRLHSYWRSSCSWRVRIVLNLKNIDYEYVKTDIFVKNMQLSEEYAKMNSSKEVPTLEIDGHVLCQSLPIMEYLDETRPDVPLFPTTAIGKARVRRISEIINSGTQPIQNLVSSYRSLSCLHCIPSEFCGM